MNDTATLNATCLIQGVGVHKSYKTARETLHVLKDADLGVVQGEVLGIVGASGVGKSTLLHVLGGLDRPDAGQVLFKGTDIYSQGSVFLDRFRNRKIGFVFQFFNLLPDFTALENAMFPALIGDMDKKMARERAEALLVRMGLKDRLTHKPGELSGGESQRVALARSLINQPDLLLADEPTGNLDARAGDALLDLIRELNQTYGQTFVLVTHSQRIASRMDRVLELAGGKVQPIDKDLIL
ncbi:MAG: ABC transporter ATP-binding protein [Nitrospinaceae bacterium]|nr:MAG: ABC transporter ATP-binding protein [Nitrospinaceae bacterium]